MLSIFRKKPKKIVVNLATYLQANTAERALVIDNIVKGSDAANNDFSRTFNNVKYMPQIFTDLIKNVMAKISVPANLLDNSHEYEGAARKQPEEIRKTKMAEIKQEEAEKKRPVIEAALQQYPDLRNILDVAFQTACDELFDQDGNLQKQFLDLFTAINFFDFAKAQGARFESGITHLSYDNLPLEIKQKLNMQLVSSYINCLCMMNNSSMLANPTFKETMDFLSIYYGANIVLDKFIKTRPITLKLAYYKELINKMEANLSDISLDQAKANKAKNLLDEIKQNFPSLLRGRLGRVSEGTLNDLLDILDMLPDAIQTTNTAEANHNLVIAQLKLMSMRQSLGKMGKQYAADLLTKVNANTDPVNFDAQIKLIEHNQSLINAINQAAIIDMQTVNDELFQQSINNMNVPKTIHSIRQALVQKILKNIVDHVSMQDWHSLLQLIRGILNDPENNLVGCVDVQNEFNKRYQESKNLIDAEIANQFKLLSDLVNLETDIDQTFLGHFYSLLSDAKSDELERLNLIGEVTSKQNIKDNKHLAKLMNESFFDVKDYQPGTPGDKVTYFFPSAVRAHIQVKTNYPETFRDLSARQMLILAGLQFEASRSTFLTVRSLIDEVGQTFGNIGVQPFKFYDQRLELLTQQIEKELQLENQKVGVATNKQAVFIDDGTDRLTPAFKKAILSRLPIEKQQELLDEENKKLQQEIVAGENKSEQQELRPESIEEQNQKLAVQQQENKKQATQQQSFLRRNWKKMLIAAGIVAAVTAVSLFSAGTFPVIIGTVASLFGVSMAKAIVITGTSLAIGSIAVGASLGAAASAAISPKDTFVGFCKRNWKAFAIATTVVGLAVAGFFTLGIVPLAVAGIAGGIVASAKFTGLVVSAGLALKAAIGVLATGALAAITSLGSVMGLISDKVDESRSAEPIAQTQNVGNGTQQTTQTTTEEAPSEAVSSPIHRLSASSDGLSREDKGKEIDRSQLPDLATMLEDSQKESDDLQDILGTIRRISETKTSSSANDVSLESKPSSSANDVSLEQKPSSSTSNKKASSF